MSTQKYENCYLLGGMYTYYYHDGRYSDWGDYSLSAAKLALEDINNSKMLDKDLVLPDELINDYHCWPEGAADIAEKLMQENILALTGIDCSGPAEIISKVATKYQIPAISNGANASSLTCPKEHPYFIRVVTPSETYDGYLVSLAAHLGIKDAVFLYTTDAWGIGASKVVKEYAKKYNMNLKEEIAYERDTSVEAMVKLIEKYKDSKNTFIVTAPTPDTVTVFKALGALDMNQEGNFIFAAEMVSADEVPEAVYGSYGYFAPMTLLPPTEKMKDFTQRFSKYIDTEVDVNSKAFAYAAISYDHILMIAHAIKDLLDKKEEVNPVNLMQALRNVDFQGVTGRVAVIENTNDRAYMAVQFFNNQGYTKNNTVNFISAGSINPETEEVIFDKSIAKFPGQNK